MMTEPVRVRFPPSPTGRPHVGNIRTALFNWLFARHTGGRFILRIEDTDQAREVAGARQYILDSLRWLGLDWDEGPEVGGPYAPYVQSARIALYQEHAERLIAAGYAYRCYCTRERLQALEEEQRRNKQLPGYDRHCRDLPLAERRALEAAGRSSVVRLRMPLAGKTIYDDYLRGEIATPNENLVDHVLLKTDGFPTYHLANVVDDHLMAISHVIRGEDWLPSTPYHVVEYEGFGWTPPVFVHLPLIVGPDRQKLSKRHGTTALLDFRDEGYLPEALFNYLGLLGWSLDDHTELISRAQFIEHFTLERLVRNPAVFNYGKLNWFNGEYIRGLDPDELADRLLPFLERDLPPAVPRPVDRAPLRAITPDVQTRIERLDGATALVDFLYLDQLHYDPALLIPKKADAGTALRVLRAAHEALLPVADWQEPLIEEALRALEEQLGLKRAILFHPIRVAISGKTVSPPLFSSLAVLGRERALDRLRQAAEMLTDRQTV